MDVGPYQFSFNLNCFISLNQIGTRSKHVHQGIQIKLKTFLQKVRTHIDG